MVTAFEFSMAGSWTYSTPAEVAVISHNGRKTYLVPQGYGYNSENGFGFVKFNEKQFLKRYSLTYVKAL